MPSRNLQYDSDNISFDEAEGIVIREMKENSNYSTEVTGQDFGGSTTVTSSMNVANVLRLDGVIRVELKGKEMVMDAIQEALDTQANGTGRNRPMGGEPDRDLGGTGPNDRGFTPADPPSAPDVGEDIEQDQDWYVTVTPDWDYNISAEEPGQEPLSDREFVDIGPFDNRTGAQMERNRIRTAYENKNAEEIKDLLIDRFWVYGSSEQKALIDVLTTDDRRGRLQAPLKLARELEYFNMAKIVQEKAPPPDSGPMMEGPDYLREEGIEAWEGVFGFIDKHPGTEPKVPSPMTDERVPMSDAEREGRLSVAERRGPQATAEIYENGIVSFDQEGNVQTLDTVAGFFIDRESLDVSMGYVGEGVDMTEDDIEEVVRAVRRSLMEQM